jgi:hypothetical protein
MLSPVIRRKVERASISLRAATPLNISTVALAYAVV